MRRQMTAAIKSDMKWNSNLYDKKHDFVFKYGEDLIDLLAPKAKERILDLGCGTGYLTNMIAEAGAEVTGIDNSAEMINKAVSEYPNLDFKVLSATDFYFVNSFNAIFSNAVLHWVAEKEKAVECMYKNLKSTGRIVVEFGGKDNVKNIIVALRQVLLNHQYKEKADLQMWYFPSVAEYTTILEQQGFTVNYAAYFERETELKDNANGIKDWIKMFGSAFLNGIDESEVETILDEVQEILKHTNYYNNKWYADYKRLRIVATKP